MCEKTDYIIRSRIRDYYYDISGCEKSQDPEDRDRIKQDKVIIQELEKILTGKGLERLSYVS